MSELSTRYTLFSLTYLWCSHIKHFLVEIVDVLQESSTDFVGTFLFGRGLVLNSLIGAV